MFGIRQPEFLLQIFNNIWLLHDKNSPLKREIKGDFPLQSLKLNFSFKHAISSFNKKHRKLSRYQRNNSTLSEILLWSELKGSYRMAILTSIKILRPSPLIPLFKGEFKFTYRFNSETVQTRCIIVNVLEFANVSFCCESLIIFVVLRDALFTHIDSIVKTVQIRQIIVNVWNSLT